MKFRKKPLIIEARQYTRDSRDEIIEWCNATHSAINEDGAPYELQNLRIPILNGSITASLGDWIIQNPSGEFSACNLNVFKESYDRI